MKRLFFCLLASSFMTCISFAGSYIVDSYKGKPYIQGAASPISRKNVLSDRDVICLHEGEHVVVKKDNGRRYILDKKGCNSIKDILSTKSLLKTISGLFVPDKQVIEDKRDCANLGSGTLSAGRGTEIDHIIVAKIARFFAKLDTKTTEQVSLNKVKIKRSNSFYFEIINKSSFDYYMNLFLYDMETDSIQCCYDEYACIYVPKNSKIAYTDAIFTTPPGDNYFLVGTSKPFNARNVEELFNEKMGVIPSSELIGSIIIVR